jgi:hypothetical protein
VANSRFWRCLLVQRRGVAIGGEGQKNAIVAGCDTIEHGFGLNQEQVNMMSAKGLYYDPTLVRYTERYMDDVDANYTGGKLSAVCWTAPVSRKKRQLCFHV